jgi:hypothetical protein
MNKRVIGKELHDRRKFSNVTFQMLPNIGDKIHLKERKKVGWYSEECTGTVIKINTHHLQVRKPNNLIECFKKTDIRTNRYIITYLNREESLQVDNLFNESLLSNAI